MYPQRLLVAETGRPGIGILPLDINRSGLHDRVEPSEQRRTGWDIRLPLTRLRTCRSLCRRASAAFLLRTGPARRPRRAAFADTSPVN